MIKPCSTLIFDGLGPWAYLISTPIPCQAVNSAKRPIARRFQFSPRATLDAHGYWDWIQSNPYGIWGVLFFGDPKQPWGFTTKSWFKFPMIWRYNPLTSIGIDLRSSIVFLIVFQRSSILLYKFQVWLGIYIYAQAAWFAVGRKGNFLQGSQGTLVSS